MDEMNFSEEGAGEEEEDIPALAAQSPEGEVGCYEHADGRADAGEGEEGGEDYLWVVSGA